MTTGGRLAEMARADSVPVIPLPGGLQPRAAVAYMIVASLEVAALCGAGPRMTSEIDVAASHTEQLVAEWGPDAAEDSLAKELARGLHGTIPVITGAGLTTPDRLPLEDPDQRERQAAVLLRANSPSSTTTRSSAGRARRLSGASRPCSSTTPTHTRG